MDEVSSLNTVFGKFCCCLGFEDRSSCATLTTTVGGGVVAGLFLVSFVPPVSDSLSSLSEKPHHLSFISALCF